MAYRIIMTNIHYVAYHDSHPQYHFVACQTTKTWVYYMADWKVVTMNRNINITISHLFFKAYQKCFRYM